MLLIAHLELARILHIDAIERIGIERTWAAVAREEKPEKQLPLRELIKEAESMRLAGQISAPYYVELHKRFALPVAALVFTVMAFPLGIRSQRGGRAAASRASSEAIVVA